jgi:hypothetical protein
MCPNARRAERQELSWRSGLRADLMSSLYLECQRPEAPAAKRVGEGGVASHGQRMSAATSPPGSRTAGTGRCRRRRLHARQQAC